MAPTRSATELRLALVCYGGVSLAVYMHGVTKELHKLVRASRRFDAAGDVDAPNPFDGEDGADTEAVYFEALRGLARAGAPVSVTIDVVAGTSAGGINGVVLAKALARDASQDALKRVWLDEGDLRRLLRAPRLLGPRTQAAWALGRQLLQWKRPTSPLRGERMSRLLVEALRDMDGAPSGTLLPPGGRLELSVTATDLHGFEVLVPSGAGGASQRDRYHAQVLEFRADAADTSAFGPEGTPELAFAARATSAFPGAFAPVGLASFQQESGTAVQARADLFRHHYDEHGLRAEDAWFVDGGVLDNAPFGSVVDAIRRRRAETEVVRRVLYLQPDPGRPLGERGSAPSGEAVGWLDGLWRSALGVRTTHPVLRELLALRDINARVAQVGSIAQQHMAEVLELVRRSVGASPLADGVGGVDSKERVQSVSDAMHEQARTALGPAWPTYQRLKVEAAGRRLADEVARRFVQPPDSSRSSFVRAALGAWARSRPEWSDADPQALVRLLGPVDMPYRERRLMFLLAGVNNLYARVGEPGAPTRESLDALKTEAWNLLDALRAVPARVVAEVPDQALAFLGADAVDAALLRHPEAYAADHAAHFERLFVEYRDALARQLGDGSTPLWHAFERGTQGWAEEHRLALLSRYLGFPLWDGLIFPSIALSELPQFTPIEVSQLSPLAASALPTPKGGKLKGVALHHFGAFVDREWRENDYLWGRLDAVELVLRLLHETPRHGQPDGEERLAPVSPAEAVVAAGGVLLVDGLRRVLASERDLEAVSELRSRVERQVDDLAALT